MFGAAHQQQFQQSQENQMKAMNKERRTRRVSTSMELPVKCSLAQSRNEYAVPQKNCNRVYDMIMSSYGDIVM